VRIETMQGADGVERGCITVADDGKGFVLAADGGGAIGSKAARGLRNMQDRAARCGAELGLSSGAGGTEVKLQLPHRFPDSDAATG